jgi:hypothetical protein
VSWISIPWADMEEREKVLRDGGKRAGRSCEFFGKGKGTVSSRGLVFIPESQRYEQIVRK